MTKEQRLAREIADALNDHDAIPLYESFALKYSEAYLRKLLQRVLSVPQDQIRRTRGALFTYLVGKNNGKDATRD